MNYPHCREYDTDGDPIILGERYALYCLICDYRWLHPPTLEHTFCIDCESRSTLTDIFEKEIPQKT
jgi:hypothetical protein